MLICSGWGTVATISGGWGGAYGCGNWNASDSPGLSREKNLSLFLQHTTRPVPRPAIYDNILI